MTSNKYMDTSKVLEFVDQQLDSKTEQVKVICYFNGVFWICPNPQREDLVHHFEKRLYEKGHLVDRRIVFLTTNQFKDPGNWRAL